MLHKSMETRAEWVGLDIIENRVTVSSAAARFGVSKSTVLHIDRVNEMVSTGRK